MTTYRLAALVAVVLLGLMSHGTFAGSGDEPHYLVISHSIAFDHVRNAPLALALGGLALASLLRGRQTRPAAALGSVLAGALAVRLWVTHHLWGTWVTSPHASLGSWTGPADAVREAGVRLTGLMIDQEFGLLPYCPIAALAVLGIVPLWTRHRQLAITAGITAGFYLLCIALPMTNVHGWTGGWSPPARFLVPVLPLVAVPLAFALPRLPRATLVLALALQIGISVYTWQHPKVLWNDGDGRAAICDDIRVFCAVVPSLVRN